MTIPHLLGRPTNLNHEFSASPQDKSTRRERVKFWIFWSPKMVHYTYSLKTIVVLFFFFFFSCNHKIVTELHQRGPEILTKPSAWQSAYNGLLIPSPARPSLLPSFQPGCLQRASLFDSC